MSGASNVIPLFVSPRLPGDDLIGAAEPGLGALAPEQAREWAAWLAANTAAPWRVGEWDPSILLFTGDAESRSTVVYRCTVAACAALARTRTMCGACQKEFRSSGLAEAEFKASFVPDRNRVVDGVPDRCAVGGCPRDAALWGLCAAHGSLRQKDMLRDRGGDLADWIAAAEPYGPAPCCLVAGCPRDGRVGSGLCDRHTRRLKAAGLSEAGPAWLEREHPYLGGHQFSLAPLPALVRAEVLFALASRDGRGQRLDPTAVRYSVEVVAQAAVESIAACDLGALPKKATANVDALLRETFRTVAAAFERFCGVDPMARPVLDLSELGVRGTRGKPTARRGDIDVTVIRQEWLREIFVGWVGEAKAKTADVRRAYRAVKAASRALDARLDGGADAAKLGFADMTAIVEVFNELLDDDGEPVGRKHKSNLLSKFFQVLDWGRRTERMEGMSAGFARHSSHVIKREEVDEDKIGKALPKDVVAQLNAHMDLIGVGVSHGRMAPEHVQAMARAVYELLRDTGRRPNEIGALEADCLEREGPDWLLRYDNTKGKRLRRHLPIPTATATGAVKDWLTVRAALDLPGGSERYLFPPAGEFGQVRHLTAEQIARFIRSFADSVPSLLAEEFDEDGHRAQFDRALIFPYAFRHTYAQRYADQGKPIEILRDLMDHVSMDTTNGYYTIPMQRKREAVETVNRYATDRHGHSRPAASGLAYESKSIAVPFGNCEEPANVRAGGGKCPIRYQCAGCDYFTPDPSFLEPIEQQILEYRINREQALAMGVDEFVIRNFEDNIAAFETILAGAREQIEAMGPEERAEFEEAAAVLRKDRAGRARGVTALGMPGFGPPDAVPASA